MKKIFNILTAVALSVAAAFTFTACSDDDDEPSVSTKEVTEASLTSIIYINHGVQDVFDVVVKNSAGEKLSFATSTTQVTYMGKTYDMYPLTYTSTSKKLDLKQELTITYTVKADLNAPESVDCAILTKVEGQVKYKDGTSENLSYPISGLVSNGVRGDKLNEYAASITNSCGKLVSTFDKDGLHTSF